MSDPAATGGPPGAGGGGDPARLTPAAVDAVLADFRAWLVALPQETGDREQEPEKPGLLSPGVDLFTLVGQFAALRHDVNLQTKAARAAVEQNAEVLRQLTEARPAATEETDLRPLLKAVVDVADALALSLRQMERIRESVEPLLAALGRPRVPPRPGFFARLFGAREPAPTPEASRDPAAGKLRQLAAAAADGYAMSLRRVERVLPTFGLEPIACQDRPFDPERMEVVEVVGDSGRPTGTVVEEVRPGYLWRGKMFRFAQVRVAR
jgi:molecular chaperone GrpE